ncbi:MULTISPECIES: hypothetical protein [Pseudonocardia]|uniref:Mannose-6-phosphate isomerase n=2 Tax=Pseudonocardia TaxID=1847 RepID=A0A1Y2MHQ9_PSEAH|nr:MULTISPECIES: hypothetical protein [Pseudonocardia]OSY34814.1 hypothetical protein BG845_06500 [Pseudonocardia autotrophica]TDN73029.1 hypothetical protein C8E95_2100 [Pseudonocardia autotrophica]BBG03748.1 hypothetical protein Pdca_49570 [Pseudonocardia autotrophica]GEC26645.1 hypothetical protein PSA01_36740 [Pseudonocardia saturnea]
MTVSDVVRTRVRTEPVPPAGLLLVGPDDGYGDIALERLTLTGTWHGAARTTDRMLVVLAGAARVLVSGGPVVVLGPNEVVHVGHGRAVTVETPGGPALELILLAVPATHPG